MDCCLSFDGKRNSKMQDVIMDLYERVCKGDASNSDDDSGWNVFLSRGVGFGDNSHWNKYDKMQMGYVSGELYDELKVLLDSGLIRLEWVTECLRGELWVTAFPNSAREIANALSNNC